MYFLLEILLYFNSSNVLLFLFKFVSFVFISNGFRINSLIELESLIPSIKNIAALNILFFILNLNSLILISLESNELYLFLNRFKL